MNLFDQYGIKEVADVTIYSIHKKEDGSGGIYYVPALYLDTLKVSTVEKTATGTWATGGNGNKRLVTWDYDKNINLTLEDALCTPASLGLCWGGVLDSDWKDAQINHSYGINNANSCGGVERISRMEKAFYPRNDTVNAVVSRLLPRDGQEDIYRDWNGEEVYLSRSSVLDGTDVRGFGYVDSHPYKWRLEIESSIMSVAVVPDRFFSIYGKSYPIKRKQTVGINQPSESFKYEIIYLRGYDKYDDEAPEAKIIYHKQAEENISHEYVCAEDKEALKHLDDFTNYPYLKIRVCYDGSIRAYLGKRNVDWDLIRGINGTAADADDAWVEMPQINTEQFRGIDLWLRFDSINALSYYIITKYEENIFSIGPKKITGGFTSNKPYYNKETGSWEIPKGTYILESYSFPEEGISDTETGNISYKTPAHQSAPNYLDYATFSSVVEENPEKEFTLEIPSKQIIPYGELSGQARTLNQAIWLAVLKGRGLVNYTDDRIVPKPIPSNISKIEDDYKDARSINPYASDKSTEQYFINLGKPTINNVQVNLDAYLRIVYQGNSGPSINMDGRVTFKGIRNSKKVNEVVGLDYDLESPESVDENNQCIPCCKKANLSRSLWAYVNPKTMTPYDDDYWFHQGEPYYKKSVTLSTKEAPIKAKRIVIDAGTFPGMYKIVGETYIRSRDTGEDERMQFVIPLCKIKSDQTITLQADGDPTTFNLDVEVATPENGVQMEINFYEVETDVKQGCNGSLIPKDGSTKISAQ